ncbi:hypothetical protein WK68_12940 [Burkholderia ubonensis]|nr:hypothetical protein WK68_12940 [Burkholderia ubonensis]
MNAKSAAEVLATYMRENGSRLPKLDRHQLEQLSLDESVSRNTRQAAEYMLDHSDVFERIQALDQAPPDGFARTGDFERAASGGPRSTGKQMNTGNVSPQPANGPQQVNNMTGPKAAGIVAEHMRKNNMDTLDWNGAYRLAVNADGNTPPEVQRAAKWMLEHRSETTKMSAHDPNSPEDYITATALNKAAQGEDPAGGPPNASTESRVIAAYMREKELSSLSYSELVKLSTDKDTPPRVRQAAKYMLDHPDEFKQIDARDGTTPDSLASVEDFEWAASGGLGSTGKQMNTDNVSAQPANGPQRDDGVNVQKTPNVGNVSPQPANGPQQVNSMTGPKAAGIVAEHMRKNNMDTLDWNGVNRLAVNADGNTPPEVQRAAKWMLEHRQETTKMSALDPNSPEDNITVIALNKAAQGEDPAGGPSNASTESRVIAAYMREKELPSLSYSDLVKLSTDKDAPPRVRQAAKYMLDHSDEFRQIDARDGTTPDGLVSVDDFEYTSQYGSTNAQA